MDEPLREQQDVARQAPPVWAEQEAYSVVQQSELHQLPEQGVEQQEARPELPDVAERRYLPRPVAVPQPVQLALEQP
ncbi:MAG TPA: hypothetical protein VGR36_02840 [Candidatus Acidoferrales bacterium]|nr:hypothetical protein [Candidatus Acidoferrales bacterium]